jgi:hypothetical protein
LIEQGQIYREAVRWERKAIAELTIPQSVKEAIGRRLNRLSADSLEVLQHAAVLGKTFDFTELSTAFAMVQPEDRLLDALDAALGAQLVRAGAQCLYLHTRQIRQVLYEELNDPPSPDAQYIGQGLSACTRARRSTHVQTWRITFSTAATWIKLCATGERGEQARRLHAFDEALAYCSTPPSPPSAQPDGSTARLNETLGDIRFDRGVFYEPSKLSARAGTDLVAGQAGLPEGQMD